ncbi:Tubulin polyglutamylase TTLL13P [Lamellibrachia satsuma]|nr:Tubulin polyglutamylase TTLL13P [Lamellibrachia satsuma]
MQRVLHHVCDVVVSGEGAYEEDGEGDTEDLASTIPEETVAEEEKKADLGASGKPKKKKRRRKKCLYVCLTNCKYESVRRVSRRFGFKEVAEDDDWNLFWTDYSVNLERVMDMKKYQKINHFPSMSEICRKDMLARNMNRMLKLFPKEYNVFPKSWCLPADFGDFQAHTRQKKHKTYILKPESGCQGKGIWVTKNPKEIKSHEHMLCQQYISKPFLIDGFKFDLRIYTLVTSCDPLRIFIFKDGLARFATAKYIEPTNHNVNNVYMHLTNYAINKNSSDFVRDDEAGSKRRITTVNKWMRLNGYDVDKIWADIDDVIIKTLISAHPIIKHNYRTCFPNHVRGSACFEILGFDVVLDRKLKPFLLEVNHSPSFHTDAKLDKEIKEALIMDTLHLINFGAVDRRKCIEEEKRKVKERLFQKQNRKDTKPFDLQQRREELDRAQQKWMAELDRYEKAHMGNFRRIYPEEGSEKYDKFFHNSGSLYQETAACKARSMCARQQREEIMRRQEKLEAMIKKKKDYLRPESPGSNRRRRAKRLVGPTRRLTSGSRIDSYQSVTSLQQLDSARSEVDTSKPMDIIEDEELERISSLLQRDNLVRGLGIVEHVYRLLHCTPGTMGIQMKNDKYLYPHNHHMKHKRLPDLALLGSADSPHRTKATALSESNAKFPLWYQENSSVEKLKNKVKVAHSLRMRSDGSNGYVGNGQKVAAGVNVDHITGDADPSECVSEPGLHNNADDTNARNNQHEGGRQLLSNVASKFSYNVGGTNGSYSLQKTMYHHGLVNTQARDMSQWKLQQRNAQSLGQLTERALPLRTRYSTRKQNVRTGDPASQPEPDLRHMSDLDYERTHQPTTYGRHGYESRGDSANTRKMGLSNGSPKAKELGTNDSLKSLQSVHHASIPHNKGSIYKGRKCPPP